jgi:succinate dehydrogenase / fumarate reductase, iron-sulfur subunit
MKVELVLHRDGEDRPVTFEYRPREEGERPMALDVLLQAQAGDIPDLSFRYGCRNRACGMCTIDVNGRPRLSCRARLKEGDTVSAPGDLPVLRDLIARRDGIARQLRGRLPNAMRANDLDVPAGEDFHALTACVECYACLHDCPMHARNFIDGEEQRDEGDAYRWGNPFTLLKLQRLRLDPLATESDREGAMETARKLGLDACVGCPGCKCGIGIDLKGKVIAPLLEHL